MTTRRSAGARTNVKITETCAADRRGTCFKSIRSRALCQRQREANSGRTAINSANLFFGYSGKRALVSGRLVRFND